MTVESLLAELEARGIRLWVEEGELRFKAKKGALTAELKDAITSCKPELLLRLAPAPPAGEELVAMPRGGILPFSFAQDRIWFLEEVAPQSLAYVVPVALALDGPLVAEALRASLTELVRRHEILRTMSASEGDDVGQRIVAPFAVELPCESLASDDEGAIAAWIRGHLDARFSLDRAPLWRAHLGRLGPDRHVFLLVVHLFVGDGWSLEIFLGELGRLYAAIAAGRRPDLAQSPLQYADYAAWQKRTLDQARVEAAVSACRERLRDVAPLPIPTDRPRPRARSDRGGTVRFAFTPETTAAIRSFGRVAGFTPFTVLLAGLDGLLARWSGRDDVLVGTVVSDRSRAATEKMLGSFANNLLLRTRLAGGPGLREVARRVAETTAEAFAYQDVPLEVLLERLDLPGGARVPELQVLFIYHQTNLMDTMELPGLSFRRIPVDTGATRIELSLTISDEGTSFAGWLDFSRDLFDDETAAALPRALESLLGQGAHEPERALASFALELPTDQAASTVAAAEGAPRAAAPVDGPSTATERVLADIWSGALELDGIGRFDNFFDLGGHSLQAVKVLAAIEERLGVRVNPGDLMVQSLGQLGALCDQRCAQLAASPERKDGRGLMGRMVGAFQRAVRSRRDSD